jgi:hypothetical protein
MKITSRTKYAKGVLAVMIWMLSVAAPASVEAGVAHARASAEVIDPAVIDTVKIMADAAADAAEQSAGKTDAKQVQPEGKISVLDGVTVLTIDYN